MQPYPSSETFSPVRGLMRKVIGIGRNLSGSGGTVRCGTALRAHPANAARRYGGPGTEPFEKLPAADRVSVLRTHTFSVK